MTKYEIILYWSDEDGAFIAEVPELPGCAADGPTRQEALSAVEIVITIGSNQKVIATITINRPVMVRPRWCTEHLAVVGSLDRVMHLKISRLSWIA